MQIREQALNAWFDALQPRCSILDLASPTFLKQLLERACGGEGRAWAGDSLQQIVNGLRQQLRTAKVHTQQVSTRRLEQGNVLQLRRLGQLVFLFCLEEDSTGECIGATLALEQPFREQLLEMREFRKNEDTVGSLLNLIRQLEQQAEEQRAYIAKLEQREGRRFQPSFHQDAGQLRRVKSEYQLQRLRSANQHDGMLERIQQLEEELKDQSILFKDLQEQLADAQLRGQALRADVADKDARISALQTQLARANALCSSLESKAALLERNQTPRSSTVQLRDWTAGLLQQRLNEMQNAHRQIRKAVRRARE